MRIFNSVRRFLLGALLLLGLLQVSVTGLLLSRAWQDYQFAATVRRVDRIAAGVATAFPALGYERGRISQVLNRAEPLDAKNREYLDRMRVVSNDALAAAQVALLDYNPALGQELATLMERLAQLRAGADTAMDLGKSARDPAVVQAWVPEISAVLVGMQQVLEKLSRHSEHGDFLFDYLNQMRVGVVRLRAVTGSESARFTALVSGNRIPGPEEILAMRSLRDQADANWRELAQQISVLASPGLERSRQAIDKLLNGELHAAQNQMLAAWQKGLPSPVMAEDYSGLSLDGLGTLSGLLTEISASATSYARDINERAFRQFAGGMAVTLLTLVLIAFVIRLVTSRVISPLEQLADTTRKVAQGQLDVRVQEQGVDEVRTLCQQFNHMMDAQAATLQEIRLLNASLESKVEERTQELSSTLAQLQQAQKSMVAAEKLAALGSLVAGIGHELNSPIGNALLVASAMRERTQELGRQIQKGAIKRSDFTDFETYAVGSSELVERNLHRAAELVNSFKQVAVDQAAERRRAFALDQTVKDTVSTLEHLLRRRPIQLHLDLQPDIAMDSYPGPVAQIITNFFTNALTHGFGPEDRGDIWIACRAQSEAFATLEFRDNGLGISTENLGKIFDPFFTTRLGQGGSGLGLSIAHNLATGLLGGQLRVHSVPGEGTRFTVILARVAP